MIEGIESFPAELQYCIVPQDQVLRNAEACDGDRASARRARLYSLHFRS